MERTASTRRTRILLRDRHRCVYCAQPFDIDDLTLDHVQPKMRGGDDSEGNLVSCCRACNEAKGHQAAWSFLSTRATERQNFLAAVDTCDRSHARPVWSRHVRAIREAAR